MACGYWNAGVSEREAVFHLTFRGRALDEMKRVGAVLLQSSDLRDKS